MSATKDVRPKPAGSPALSQNQVCLHPLLFAIYPAIHLFAECYQHFEFALVWRPAILCASVTGLLWWGLSRLWNDRAGAALALFPIWIAFYSQRVFTHAFAAYGYSFAPSEWNALETGTFALLWATALAAAWSVSRTVKYRHAWTYCLNVFATILIVLPFFHIYFRSIEASRASEIIEPAAQAVLTDLPQASPVVGSSAKPDIYFIVLDSYGREDILNEFYGFDNSDFLNFLKANGFTVIDRGSSNFGHTPLSIASTLNFEYVSSMTSRQDVSWLRDWRFYREFVRNSRLTQFLRQQGYSIATVSSQYGVVDFPDADTYLTRWWFLNRFETLLLEMTPIPWLAHKLGWPLLYNLHREQMLFNIDQISTLAQLPGPKFVYAHVFAPHPPFVVDAAGHPRTPRYNYSWAGANMFFDFFQLPGTGRDLSRENFIDQTRFVNSRMREILPAILQNSATPPVIVLQSDHGPSIGDWVRDRADPSIRERFSVLNAIHLPGGSAQLYPSMSLVNTFRVVLNHCFATHLPLLEDRSYWVDFDKPYLYQQLAAAAGEPSGKPRTIGGDESHPSEEPTSAGTLRPDR
jgi:hypothetical protein